MNSPEAQSDMIAAGPLAAARPLLTALKTPLVLPDFSLEDWSLLIRQARRTRLLSRVAAQAERNGIIERLPGKVVDTLQAAAYEASNNWRIVEWEISCIERALADVDTPVVLLKGAAYVAARLPAAEGRLAGDIDIMVPEPKLDEVEAALIAHGWKHLEYTDYDQRYYRKYSHELPPLQHEQRGTVIDVHHTILPRTSRLSPDVGRLWQQTVDLDTSSMKVLGHQDMVLHSAAHLFQDGEISFAIRDLVDIVDLLNHFGQERVFWDGLVARAYEHQLQRPLYYALRYGRMLLDLDVPEAVDRSISAAAPAKPIVDLMDRIMPSALLPDDPDSPSASRAHAASLLYLRSHWLRMPPLLLAGHLTRKALMQLWAMVLQWREEKEREKEAA